MPSFQQRHIGASQTQQQQMLSTLGFETLDDFVRSALPEALKAHPLPLDENDPKWQPHDEIALLSELDRALRSVPTLKSLIGQGFKNVNLPPVLSRLILENPRYYSAYTPYQAEISQGRLEWLFQFQTLSAELTGLKIANAGLLDLASASVEAMSLCLRANPQKHAFFADENLDLAVLSALKTRAHALNIHLKIGTPEEPLPEHCAGLLTAQIDRFGAIKPLETLFSFTKAQGALCALIVDPLSAFLLPSAAELGADIALGSAQRLGLPLGFGGPHAAFFTAKESLLRQMPGRIVGRSHDRDGATAFHLALQTREQHIRREKATSNICTAQSLTAILATAYAAYQGPDGLTALALKAKSHADTLASALKLKGYALQSENYFDTLTLRLDEPQAKSLQEEALTHGFNLYAEGGKLVIALDETLTREEMNALFALFKLDSPESPPPVTPSRRTPPLRLPFFEEYQGELAMMRLIARLADKDYALDRGMIPLGSCTMKLNSVSLLSPLTHPLFGRLHPFAPKSQSAPLLSLLEETGRLLSDLTGFDCCSLQPNSGAQGEYAGLLAIKHFHEARGATNRTHCLIPKSAHGTNPASAVAAGFEPVTIETSEGGVSLQDLKAKLEALKGTLGAIMLTYPSTSGIFEESILEITSAVHEAGGLVYMDGANLNAFCALGSPRALGADVMHLNLHKTFAVPHGGGGPGVGPIVATEALRPFLPDHPFSDSGSKASRTLSAAPYAAPPAILITYLYIKLLGLQGLRACSASALLNANYLKKQLEPHYPVRHQSQKGFVAHECIVDLNFPSLKGKLGADDFAKRLADYGFHAPTVSFPYPNTFMIEPTESEPKSELDRFISAMIALRQEIREIEEGRTTLENSPLSYAPHAVTAPSFRPITRIDQVYGDRNPDLSDSVL